MRQLIITCDDCGLSEGINLATLQLHERGWVTSGTVMTNFASANHALSLFSQYPSLDVGVHLTLSDGFPLTEISSPSGLTERDRSFRHKSSLFARMLVPSKSLRQLVKSELRAQIEFFLENRVHPNHCTTHSHFHQFPSLREIVFDLAREYKVSWVRAYSYRAAVVPRNPLLRINSQERILADKETFQIPDYIVGLKWWMKYDPMVLVDKLMELHGIIEIAVHPCLPNDPTYPCEIYYTPQERFGEMKYIEKFMDVLRTRKQDGFTINSLNTGSSQAGLRI